VNSDWEVELTWSFSTGWACDYLFGRCEIPTWVVGQAFPHLHLVGIVRRFAAKQQGREKFLALPFFIQTYRIQLRYILVMEEVFTIQYFMRMEVFTFVAKLLS
jgi:hypothetical protein